LTIAIPIAAKRKRHDALSIQMVGTPPVFSSAGILIDFTGRSATFARLAEFRRTLDACGTGAGGQADFERGVAKVDGTVVAEVPKTARMGGAARIENRDGKSDRGGTGKKVQIGFQFSEPVAMGTPPTASQTEHCAQRPWFSELGLFDPRFAASPCFIFDRERRPPWVDNLSPICRDTREGKPIPDAGDKRGSPRSDHKLAVSLGNNDLRRSSVADWLIVRRWIGAQRELRSSCHVCLPVEQDPS
jgi:hypothetical protein